MANELSPLALNEKLDGGGIKPFVFVYHDALSGTVCNLDDGEPEMLSEKDAAERAGKMTSRANSRYIYYSYHEAV